MTVHGVKPFTTAFVAALGYLAGALGYVAVPVVVTLGITRPGTKTLADIVWPREPERQLIAAAFWGPLLLPAFGAVAGRTEITSLWSMPAFSLLPVLLLSSPAVTVRAIDTRRILLGAATLPLVMLIASPVITLMALRTAAAPTTAQAPLLATEIERLWHQATPQPLRFIGGDADLAYGAAAYAADRPRALTGMPQPSADELTRYGLVWICFAEDAGCRRDAVARGGVAGKLIVTQIVRNFMGFAGMPQRYTIVIVPPQF
jgi:hypothetical protein